jgi:hypothetical protein
MAQVAVRDVVFAVEFDIADSDRVAQVLHHHQDNLGDLGARYAFAYQSIVEARTLLVIIGIRTDRPLPDLLSSPHMFNWFDRLGVADIPAVFAGETVERFDVGEAPAPGTELVVAAVTPVTCVDDFVAQVRGSVEEFARAGIRRTLVYHAFDTTREVMFLQQLASPDHALTWVTRSEIASAWLESAGVGVYPPVFIGRLATAIRMDATSEEGRH